MSINNPEKDKAINEYKEVLERLSNTTRDPHIWGYRFMSAFYNQCEGCIIDRDIINSPKKLALAITWFEAAITAGWKDAMKFNEAMAKHKKGGE